MMPEGPIIVFDGVCNLCDRSVQFVLARDSQRRFRFAARQSAVGLQLLEKWVIPPPLDSVVLLVDGVAYTRSDAALRIAARLDRPWRWLRIFLGVPRPVRDWVYDLVAKHRYRWFGKNPACRIPTPELRDRFLT